MGPPPHPLAGKAGEGPPIAPPTWTWRAGNRISDMYFYSPEGKQFRSRPELARYLQTLNDPPDSSLFCWRVTDEVLKSGKMNLVDRAPKKAASKRKVRSSSARGRKRIKTELSVAQASSRQIPPSSSPLQPVARKSLPPVDPATPNVPSRHKSSSLSTPQIQGIERKRGKHVRMSVHHTFRSILLGRSSFKWLSDSDTLEKFLEEAEKLKQRSPAEISEVRQAFLGRKLDLVNICKYPNSAIRFFVWLLRTEDPPLSMGKAELAGLCVNWICKKKRYWCFSELGRVGSPVIKHPNVQAKQEDNDGQGGEVSHHVLGNNTCDQHHVEGEGDKQEIDRALKPDFPSCDGSGTAVESATRSGHTPDLRSEGNLPGKVHYKSSESPERVTFEGIASMSHLAVGSTPDEGQETSSLQPAADSVRGDTDTTIPDRGTSSNIAEGVLQREPVRSLGHETSVSTSQCVGRGLLREAAITVETGRRTAAGDMATSHIVGESASMLDGENIVVITGFKSEGVGSVFCRGEVKQLNGGPSVTVAHNLSVGETNIGQEGPAAAGDNKTLDYLHPASDLKGGFQRVEVARSENLGCKLNFGSDLSFEKISQWPCLPETLRILTDQNASGIMVEEFGQSKMHALGGLDEVRNELCSVSLDIHQSQAHKDTKNSACHAECLSARNGGIKMEQSTIGTQEGNLPSDSDHFVSVRGSLPCWCRICGTDLSFCRGCMCSFCRESLQSGEDWMVVKCICNHVSHIECAQASNVVGVVKELGLDVELSCPSCSMKVDLWPFFQKRFDLILALSEAPNVNVRSLEQHLLQAVQLLKGTEKKKYKFIEWLVVECYELLHKFSILALVRQLLRAIRDELYAVPMSGLDLNSEGVNGVDFLKEQDILDSLNTAKEERLFMEEVVEKVQRAYEIVLNKREGVSVSPAVEIPETWQNPDLPGTEELIVLQQAKLDCELDCEMQQ